MLLQLEQREHDIPNCQMWNDVPSDIPNHADTRKRNSSIYLVITEEQFQAYSKKKKNRRDIGDNKYKAHHTKCYLATMLPAARKTVSKKTLHEEHSSKTFGLRLVLVVYIMNYIYIVKRKFNGNSGILWKMDIVKMAYFIRLPSKNWKFKETNFYY